MEKSKTQNKLKNEPPNTFLRFSSVAIQMGVLITAGAFGGKWLDSKYPMKYPVFTLVGSLLGIFIGLFLVIKEVINLSKDE